MSHTVFSNLVRLYPNKAQEQLLRRSCGCRRFVYNKMLEYQRQRYQDKLDVKAEHGYISYEEMCSLLLVLKADPETAWLREANAQSLQQTIRDMDTAFRRFFAGKARYPTEKKRGRGDGFRIPQDCKISSDFRHVYLPKVGWVRCRGLRRDQLQDSTGTSTFLSVQSVTVRAVAAHFEAAVLFRVQEPAQAVHSRPGTSCGLDIGIAKPIAMADDDQDNVTFGTRVQAKLRKHDLYVKRLRRKLARQQPKSNSRQRTKTRITKAHRHAANVRKDFNHQVSNYLAKTYETVVGEALPLRSMTASAAGTVEEPGRNVRQKSGLNRELLRMGSGQFFELLEYKCLREGGELIRVNPAYSSQECRKCGHTSAENRKNQAVFRCVACGHTENADYHASGVVRLRGLRVQKTAAGTRPGGAAICRVETEATGSLAPVAVHYNLIAEDKAGFRPWHWPSVRDTFMLARQFNKRVIDLYSSKGSTP
jgi:putative transposase